MDEICGHSQKSNWLDFFKFNEPSTPVPNPDIYKHKQKDFQRVHFASQRYGNGYDDNYLDDGYG